MTQRFHSSIQLQFSSSRLAAALSGALVFLAALGPAQAASDSELRAARAAAQAGDAAVEAGRHQEALELFQRADTLHHAPTLRVRIARALAKLGRYVKAEEAYLQVIRENVGPNAPTAFVEAKAQAEAELPAISAQVARVTITVSGPPSAELTLTLDGEPLPSAVLELPYPADPGAHVLEISAVAYLPVRHSFELGSNGDVQSVSLELQPDPNYVPPKPSAAASTDSSEAPPSGAGAVGAPLLGAGAATSPAAEGRGLPVPAYIGFGVGAVGAVLGTVFLVQRGSYEEEAKSLFLTCVEQSDREGKCDDPNVKTAVEEKEASRDTAGVLAMSGYILGGLGVAAGVTFWLLDSADTRVEHSALRISFDGQQLNLAGRF